MLYSSLVHGIGAVGAEVRRLVSAKGLNDWPTSRIHLVLMGQKQSYRNRLNWALNLL